MGKSQNFDYIRRGFESYGRIVDKDIIYVYKKGNNYEEIVLKARKADFMHLCGVKYKDPTSRKRVNSKHFYNLVETDKISTDFLEEKNDGTTELKLKIIVYLDELLTGNVSIIDEEINFLNSRFAGAIRTRKMIFALGLYQGNNFQFGPKSLINLKTTPDNLFKGLKSYKVHKVYYKNSNADDFIFFESEEHKKEHIKKGQTH